MAQLNPSIILAGRQPDIVGQMGRGAQTAGLINAVGRENRLMDLFREQGPQIMAGDQGALNALAQLNPQQALGVQQTRLGMDATRQNMSQSAEMHQAQLQQIRQNAAKAAAEAAKQENAERLAAETEEAQKIVSMALMDPANADKYLSQSEHTRDFVGQPLEAVAVAIMGAQDGLKWALERQQGPESTAAMQTLEARAAAAGLQPGTPEYQQFMLQGGKQPETMSFEVGPDGGVSFSTGTGEAKPVKTTEGEKSAAGYLSRMRAAEGTLDTLSADEPAVRSLASLLVGGSDFEGLVLSDRQQKILQAQRDWVRAKLRKESGAVIGPEEMAEEIRTYFPLPGEGPEVVEQKRKSRLQAERQFEIMSGPAAEPKAEGTKREITLDMIQSDTPPNFVSESDAELWPYMEPIERQAILGGG